jgi:hypothetical protein
MISLYWNWIKDSIFTFLVTCSFYMMFNSDLALVFSIFRSMFRGSLGSSMFRLSFFGEVYRFSNLFSNHQLCRFWNGSVEYNVSYVYHAMFAYFDRDNVALKGLAK